ncbi:MobQ family relaxase [Asticcacaulis benevestitus]|uniref:MobA/MobL protein domain-containing protein n=1 Tax=Asticcacaulis benevestitus DSM 16100 = ATCC BAA-896 TaxID=1121022 RepID=V4PCG8_9CAUL|nr:MobQ family relaxase [Asticcacaulis benevestitus]ESQ82995.1 hypothetical protein ABENE_20520 [Asticcacaulis benevestitus DSM 16100 = ATCC BAA-896]
MAQFSMRVLVVKRSAGQSIIAAAAYRSGEKLRDDRQDITHDFRHKSTGVEHKEMLFPDYAPAWVQGISREDFWNAVDKSEVRKDAQTARDLRVMIPREIKVEDRVPLVRDFVIRNFVSKGMVADICWHNTTASDGQEQPHAHILLTMRPLAAGGFGPKSRHDRIPDPSGRTRPDGRPLMIESNADSWNSIVYYEQCREAWEKTANDALARIGSEARIDRRSLIDRGLARLPEPALRLAFHLKELRGVMRERFGQFQYAKHYQAVEKRAGAAFQAAEPDPVAAIHAGYESGGRGRDATPAQKVARFVDWFQRQIERLAPRHHDHAMTPAPERAPPQSPPNLDLER